MQKKESEIQELNQKNSSAGEPRQCIYCGAEAPLVWVHGHGQCAKCGINVEECCRGEQCNLD
ncbi:hypothetical protein [Aliifodinibius sp. S!AR15-10]|uniref:hypothetical protein n=1 Tax=Aliifodinibius sp. S!AR15-10 TaxID=2950437 RepID=UPI0028709BB9|nr:hypothetical protein [Aliifodinibius sp. S!AR15-10]